MKNRVKTSRGIAILAIGFVLALAAIGLFLKQFDSVSQLILPHTRPAQAALDGAGSDNDGRSDKEEITAGYSPIAKDKKLVFDPNLAKD